MRLRLALALAALVVGAGPGWADAAAVNVDRIYESGSYIHILMRYTNTNSFRVATAKIDCSVFDKQQQALGSEQAYPQNVRPGQTVVSDILMTKPPETSADGASADCRLVTEIQ